MCDRRVGIQCCLVALVLASLQLVQRWRDVIDVRSACDDVPAVCGRRHWEVRRKLLFPTNPGVIVPVMHRALVRNDSATADSLLGIGQDFFGVRFCYCAGDVLIVC